MHPPDNLLSYRASKFHGLSENPKGCNKIAQANGLGIRIYGPSPERAQYIALLQSYLDVQTRGETVHSLTTGSSGIQVKFQIKDLFKSGFNDWPGLINGDLSAGLFGYGGHPITLNPTRDDGFERC